MEGPVFKGLRTLVWKKSIYVGGEGIVIVNLYLSFNIYFILSPTKGQDIIKF